MKCLKMFLVLLFLVALSTTAYAESSKLLKVDLDVKTTKLIKADLDIDDLYYYMDTAACICWVSQNMGSSFSIATFPCEKLAAHSKLEGYVEECLNTKASSKAAATTPEENKSATEVKDTKEEKKESKSKQKSK